MQVRELKNEGLSHEMEITIPATDIDSLVDVKLKEVGKTMKMPGFRPGKVPLKLLKQKYGKAVLGEVLEKAVNDASEKVLKDRNLRAALRPDIEVKTFDEGEDLIYTMKVQVLPKIEIRSFKGAKFEKLTAKPDDKSVRDALERIAKNQGSTKKIETARAAKEGDTLVMDFHGRTADDNKEHPGMHAHGHRLKLGSGQFIPGFEDQLIGKKTGEKVEVKLDFPKDYGAKELAGRSAIFGVDIHEIHEDSEATIDDEFAKSLGLDDLKALEKAIAEQLQKELDSQGRMVLKKSLLDYLDDTHKFEVPAGMVDLEYNNVLQQIEMDQKRQGKEGALSDVEKEELKQISERRVRLGLTLAEIGNQNNIKVADPELQRAVIVEAQRYPGQEKDVFEYYSKNPYALESLRAPLFEEKVVDYILELSEVTGKETTSEALMKMLEEEEPYGAKKKDGDEKSTKAKKPAKK
ncbi:MAG: trigger factor [Alphaproteobacteria bacterium]